MIVSQIIIIIIIIVMTVEVLNIQDCESDYRSSQQRLLYYFDIS